jgi:hypothetical protein
MSNKNLWISAISGAVLTTLVSNLPLVGFVNILCFAGFWGGAIFAVWLYRRLNSAMSFHQAILVGLLTGICAGSLGFGISFLGLAGFQGMSNELARLLPPEDLAGLNSAPLSQVLTFNFCGVLTNIFFGTLGGLLGGALFRTDRTPTQTGEMA